jgi:hypothetical protein
LPEEGISTPIITSAFAERADAASTIAIEATIEAARLAFKLTHIASFSLPADGLALCAERRFQGTFSVLCQSIAT